MKEGAWIQVRTGSFHWIREHASAMQCDGLSFGLPRHVWEEIRVIPNDFAGENRRRILLAVMDAGFIRVRGHGVQVSFEFTCPISVALPACQPFLSLIAGPELVCQFTDLKRCLFLRLRNAEIEELLVSGLRGLQAKLEPVPCEA